MAPEGNKLSDPQARKLSYPQDAKKIVAPLGFLNQMMDDERVPVPRLQPGKGLRTLGSARHVEEHGVRGALDADARDRPRQRHEQHLEDAPLEVVERLIHLSPRSTELGIEDACTEESGLELPTGRCGAHVDDPLTLRLIFDQLHQRLLCGKGEERHCYRI